MALKESDVGDPLRLRSTYTNESGAAANPTTVVLTLRDPAGVVTTPAVTNPAVGTFENLLVPATPGVWRFRWDASGGVTASDPGAFYVRPRAVP